MHFISRRHHWHEQQNQNRIPNILSFNLLGNCLLDTIGESVKRWVVATLGWNVKIVVFHHFQIVHQQLVIFLKLAVQRQSWVSRENEEPWVVDECQIPIFGIKPNTYGILLTVFSKMIRSLEFLTKATSDVGKVRPPILIFNLLFLSWRLKVEVFPLALVFDKLFQVEALFFYAADNVFSLGAIAKMADDIS